MKVRLVYHILDSGERHLAIANFPLDIDLQEWAEKRRKSFKLLGIKALVYEDIFILKG